LMSPLVEVS